MTQATRPIVSLQDRAAANLRYIRDTMERAGSFTAVPGRGGIAMGGIALAAGFTASRQGDFHGWLTTWMWAAALAFLTGLVTMGRKAAAARTPLLSGPGRKFALALVPPLLAGALLTLALRGTGNPALIAGAWMLLYGAGITAGGAHSVRVVPVMGCCFLALGAATLFTRPEWANLLLTAGFGVLHIAFGIVITRKYGG
jgi:hypothetical protein